MLCIELFREQRKPSGLIKINPNSCAHYIHLRQILPAIFYSVFFLLNENEEKSRKQMENI